MSPSTAPALAVRSRRKSKIGLVVSDKMAKTIVVRVTRLTQHQKYGRTVKMTSTFKAHDETNSAKIGDWVRIMETRPISKDKCWRLVEIITRGSTAPPVPAVESEAAAHPGKAK